jgi:hypothetical protein
MNEETSLRVSGRAGPWAEESTLEMYRMEEPGDGKVYRCADIAEVSTILPGPGPAGGSAGRASPSGPPPEAEAEVESPGATFGAEIVGSVEPESIAVDEVSPEGLTGPSKSAPTRTR